MKTPPQINGFDCGVYLMAITHILVDRMIGPDGVGKDGVSVKPGDLSRWQLSHIVTPEVVAEKRLEVKDIILALAKAPRRQ